MRYLLLILIAAALSPGTQAQNRIVSTAPSLTETLFSLDLGPHVVGVSQYCEYPPQVKSLPKVGTYVQPNTEIITRLRPDLVLLEKASNEVSSRLNAVHIPFVEIPHGTLAQTFEGIGVIAQATGVPSRGNALIQRLQAGLAQIRAEAATKPHPRVLMVVDRRPGTLTDIIATGPNNYENELIEASGAINVLAHPGIMTYPRISLETILREDPDYIIDLTDAHDTDPAHIAARAADLALWLQNSGLKAARNHHIYMADTSVFVVPGPRLLEATQRLYTLFHTSGPLP